MALKLNNNRSLASKKLVGAFFAVFALMIAPFYGIVADQVANAVETTNVTYDFNDYAGGSSWAGHPEWSFSGSEAYTGSSSCGAAANCIKLNHDGDRATLTLPDGQTASSLRFHLKQMPAGDNSDSLLFMDLYDGPTHLGNYVVSSVSDADLPINPLTDKIALSIGKVGGNNLSLDDISVTTTSASAPMPQLTNVDPYYVVDKYKGIAVDISVDKLTDATGVEVRVDRSSGGPAIKTNKAGGSVLATLNTGNPAKTTAPIVIQQGTYDEAGSSSWNQPAQAWGSDTVPTKVTVTITRASGDPLVREVNLTESMGPFATLSQVIPSAPAPVVEACNMSSFDGFALGSVNGQGGWKVINANFDQEIVNNTYGYEEFGCKTLRMSNSYTSGGFGNQVFSAPAVELAGEGVDNDHFEAEFSFGSTKPTEQTGMAVSISPDDGTGNRMSYIGLADVAGGISVTFYEADEDGNVVTPQLLDTVSRNEVHTIKFVIDFVEGESNDVVKIYLDGELKHAGTTWEQYYRLNPEQAGNGNVVPNVDRLIFRLAGTAAPANDGNGYLFDGVSVTTSQTTPQDTTAPTFAIESPADGSVVSGTVEIRARVEDPSSIKKLLMTIPTKTGNKTYVYEMGKPNNSLLKDSDTYSVNVDTTTLNDGIVHVVLRGTDGAGNTRYWNNNANSRQHSFTVDNTAPDITEARLNDNTAGIAGRVDNCGPTDFNHVRGVIGISADINDSTGSGVASAEYRVLKINTGGCVMSNPAVDYGGGVHGYGSATFQMHNIGGDVWTGADFDTNNVPEDGNYTIKITTKDTAGNTTVRYVDITVDNMAPVVDSLSIDRPVTNEDAIGLNGKVFDANLKNYNVRVYNSDKSNLVDPWIGSAGTGSSDEVRTLAMLNIASLADGDYWVRIWADDLAGNRTGISSHIYVPFTIDRTNPSVSASLSSADIVTGGAAPTVTVNASDATSGIDYVQYKVMNPDGSTAAGWFTINNNEATAAPAISGLTPGSYKLRARAYDNAGNKKSGADVAFIVHAVSVPAVNGENFNTHSGSDYKGLNIGFNIANFSEVTGVTVELYDGDTLMVANTHNAKLLHHINILGNKILSTPFITVPGTYTEEYWELGEYDWTSGSPQPTKAVVAVTGTNNLGQSDTYTATLENLSEPNGWTFASILPKAETTPFVDRPVFINTFTSGPGSSLAPLLNNVGVNNLFGFFGNPAPETDTNSETTETNESNDESDVLGTQDNSGTPLSDTAVLGAEDKNGNFLGLTWLWWLGILAALVVGWLILASIIRRVRGADA